MSDPDTSPIREKPAVTLLTNGNHFLVGPVQLTTVFL